MDPTRFLEAQDDVEGYALALSELRRGKKTSHWIWYVFPQIEGLGRSPTAERFALASDDDARAYLQHPILGERLVRAAEVVEQQLAQGTKLLRLMGSEIDALKLVSCMTLFAIVGQLGVLFVVDPLRARGPRPADGAAIDRSAVDRLPTVRVATTPVVWTDAAPIAEASLLGGIDGATIWRRESGDRNQGSTFRTGSSGALMLEWTHAGLCALDYEGDLRSGRPPGLTLRVAGTGVLVGAVLREQPRARDAVRWRYELDDTEL